MRHERTTDDQAAIDRAYQRIDEAVARMWQAQQRRDHRRRTIMIVGLVICIFMVWINILDFLIGSGFL